MSFQWTITPFKHLEDKGFTVVVQELPSGAIKSGRISGAKEDADNLRQKFVDEFRAAKNKDGGHDN